MLKPCELYFGLMKSATDGQNDTLRWLCTLTYIDLNVQYVEAGTCIFLHVKHAQEN